MARIPIDPAGWPFVAGALGAGAIAGLFVAWPLALACGALAAFFLFFFRDPERRPSNAPRAVLSPADGRVLIAGAASAGVAPPGRWKQVSIFLSPMDVHVNRVPVSGRITRATYSRGRFLPAYRDEAGTTNERSEIWIDAGGQTVVARQIVGILARRVVCRLAEGDTVRAGDRYGIMKFGSRMDVFVPETAEICVRVGQQVRACETVLAVLHSA
jgi:phosphatidylserine decarboxylase